MMDIGSSPSTPPVPAEEPEVAPEPASNAVVPGLNYQAPPRPTLEERIGPMGIIGIGLVIALVVGFVLWQLKIIP